MAYAVEADAEAARLEHAELLLTVEPWPVGPGAGQKISDGTEDVPGDAEVGGPTALRARLFGHVPHAPKSGRGETPLKAPVQPPPPLKRAGHVSVQVRRPKRLDLVGLATVTVEEAAPSHLGGRYLALGFTESDARDLCASLGLDPATALGRLAPVP